MHGQTTEIPSAQDEGAPADFYTYSGISAGGRHTCGLRTDGNIRCWGDNLRGQATPPGGNDELRASEEDVGDFAAVSAGDSHTCGLRPRRYRGVLGTERPRPGHSPLTACRLPECWRKLRLTLVTNYHQPS